jgi:hypothetical protein
LAASAAFYWKTQIALTKAEIKGGEYRLDIGTENYIRALERLIPFHCPTEGEPPASAGGSGVHNVPTSNEDEDPVPRLRESDDNETLSDFKMPEDGESDDA